MKRTQLYLDDATARILAAVSRERKTTVSELVRESVRTRYASRRDFDRSALARQISGIWKNRKDLRHVEQLIRKLRRDTRPKRFGLG